jgi:hypothetical protein
MARFVEAGATPGKAAACPLRRGRQSQAKLYVRALLLSLRFTMKNSSNRLIRSIGERWSALTAAGRCPDCRSA